MSNQKKKPVSVLTLLSLMLLWAPSATRAASDYWAEFGGSDGVVNEVGPGYVIVDGHRMSLPPAAPVLNADGARLSTSALSKGQWIEMWFNPAFPSGQPVLERIVIRGPSGE